MVNQFKGSAKQPPQFTRGYGLVFGQSERKAMAMALVDRALRAREFGEESSAPAQDEEFVISHSDNVQATGFVEHLKLPHYVDFQAELDLVRAHARRASTPRRDERRADAGGGRMTATGSRLQFRLSRRADQADDPPRDPQGDRHPRLPGAVRQPRDADALWLGHRRRPGDGRDHRPRRVLKVIDQGSDDTTNAVSIRAILRQDRRRRTTTETAEATIIQTRHRIPETPLDEGQMLVYQVPIPEPLRFLEPRETETRQMHALAEYGLMHVKLYEDIARHGHIATTYAYPVEGRGPLRDGPLADAEIRQSENERLRRRCSCSAPAARSASTPFRRTPRCVSLDFEDHPFERAGIRRALRAVRRDRESISTR